MMEKDKNRSGKMWKMFFLAIALAFLLTSCATTQRQPAAVPDIPYPEFPVNVSDTSVSVTLDNDVVKIAYADGKTAEITLWLWLEFVSYSIDADSAISQYEAVVETLNR